jgi:hexosaminidase
MYTRENYEIQIESGDGEINIKIISDTFFGFRHSLETLSQLIVYDNIENNYKILSSCTIQDNAQFKHRGLTLDTSRNFFSVESIKRTIDAMAMVKLNVFHWHITDSQSFPIEIKSQPDLSRNGAYSAEQVYSSKDVKDVVEFAKIRGIRVIPEYDSPAHVCIAFNFLSMGRYIFFFLTRWVKAGKERT